MKVTREAERSPDCFSFSKNRELELNVKVVQEYERAVIFRLGRLLAGGSKGPGKWSSIFDWRPSLRVMRETGLTLDKEISVRSGSNNILYSFF